jgi:hypothetical protein
MGIYILNSLGNRWPTSIGIGDRLGAEYALARLVGQALKVKQNIVADLPQFQSWGSMPFPPNFSGRFIASQKVSYFPGRAINVRGL